MDFFSSLCFCSLLEFFEIPEIKKEEFVPIVLFLNTSLFFVSSDIISAYHRQKRKKKKTPIVERLLQQKNELLIGTP